MIETLVADSLRNLPGWMLTLYWPNGRYGARAVLVHPEYKAQIGMDGKTVDDALVAVVRAAEAWVAERAALAEGRR